jgi:phosphotransferase system enzyme I (PtsI)
MRILKGIAASAGIGTGKAFLYVHEKPVVPHSGIDPSQTAAETARFMHALDAVTQELAALLPYARSNDQRTILEAHQMMLRDPEMNKAVCDAIAIDHKCAEWAVETTMASLLATLEQAVDQNLRERGADVYDIGWRVIRSLLGKQRPNLVGLHEPVVLVADTLLPSEALSLDPAFVKAIALNGGGRTSHVAILARALQIPTVVGLGSITKKVKEGEQVIVDGNHGEVAVRPTSASASRMEQRYRRWVAHEEQLRELAKLDAVTTDGHLVVLKANVETVEEVDAVIENGGAGVGLYRSEFLFMKPGGASEEEQFHAYRSVVERMGDSGPVTIRTIDVGGDKVIPGMDAFGEENPILGWRAVRFCLARKDIFRIQLRALLRASAYGPLKIMFPMISGLEELGDVLEVLEQVKEECWKARVPFDEDIETGTMIEVPSAALCADLLAPKVDFFSIGTNDLIQYTIAVDRGNEKIAYLYQPFHPGVLRLVSSVIEKGHQAGIPVGMCGEMAGDPLFSVLLLGLGLDEFSMSPQSLLEIKSIIRSVSLDDARRLARTVMEMDSYQKINTYVKEWMHERFGNLTTA